MTTQDAVDIATQEIRWDHLSGSGTIVNYAEGWAWEYLTFNHQVVARGIARGDQTGATRLKEDGWDDN